MEVKTPRLETRRIDQLEGWGKNPRKSVKANIARLKKQIKKLGIYKPLIVNEQNIVLGGNMRLKALKELGIEEVLCSVVTAESEDLMIEYALSDNDRVGEYERVKLLNLLKTNEIELDLYRIDLGTTHRVRDLLDADTRDGNVPEPETNPDMVVSKPGEVYQLGKHRLMCGDSTSREDVETLMQSKKAQMVFTDPPYMVNYNSGSERLPSQTIQNDNLTDTNAIDFYGEVAKNLYEFTDDSSVLYWWFGETKSETNKSAVRNAGWAISQTVIWVKNYMSLSKQQLYHHTYESCLVGYKRGNAMRKNKTVTAEKDVWTLSKTEYSELADIWYEKRDLQGQYIHPTQKPVGLIERALRRNTRGDDIVLDLFGGSGSSIIGCELNNRICYTMEIDPVYCDVIRKRFSILAGRENEWQEATPKI